MKLNIKSKLVMGMAFLFAIILALGGLGFYYVTKLTEDTQNILKDNYKSLQYCNNMLQDLERVKTDKASLQRIEHELQLEEKNITEGGERQAVLLLRDQFNGLKKDVNNEALLQKTRQNIYTIITINQHAIAYKNEKANKTANTANVLISIVTAILLVVTFSFIVNFPGYIANPIQVLTEGIKEIANRNYSKRIHFKSGDEFGELAEAFNSMARKLNDYENSNLAQIMFEKKRIETIISQLNDAIIGLDAQGKILFVNPIAAKLFGTKEHEIINLQATEFAEHNDLMRTLLDRGQFENELHVFVTGKQSYFRKEYFDVKNEGESLGLVIILKNITSFKELDVAKTNFIATISHELKTPISSIKMSLSLLNNNKIGSLNTEQEALVKHIDEDAKRLLNITSELLNLSQAETGKIQLNIANVRVEAITNYALNALAMQAEEKKVQIVVNQDTKAHNVNADREKTAWVLTNLLSNAIRYSPELAKVILSVTANDGKVKFSVKDEGPGIPEQFQYRIFERYFQVPGSMSSGTGLGLAISKEFIETQGGKIEVQSEPGEGSCFSFELNA